MIPQGADTETILSTLRHFVTFGGVILLYPPDEIEAARVLLAQNNLLPDPRTNPLEARFRGWLAKGPVP